MNRQNFWIHLGLAVTLITIAALLGQFRVWEFSSKKSDLSVKNQTKACAMSRGNGESEPEVLVKFKQNVDFATVQKIVARQNDRIEDRTEAVNGLFAIDDLDDRDAQAVAAEYKLNDAVEYAEPNLEIKLAPIDSEVAALALDNDANLPNDPFFGAQWALRNTGQNDGKEKADLDAVKAWAKTKGKPDVVIAVLDSGVDYTHQDLVKNIWTRPASIAAYKDNELGTINDLHGFNSADNARDPMDDNGHGTHCAGIIGAEGDNNEGIAGINWSVQIMPLKFLGRSGSGTTKNAIEAINYVIDRKKAGVNVRVISASWGSTAYSKALEDVIRKAGDEGIMFIAAAGNDATSNDGRPHYPSNYKLPNVISVAALDRNDKLASFSNFGVKTVHIAAPGKEIMSTWLKGNYREASGTSMATPYVSGVAGLVLSLESDLTNEQLRARLFKSVDKIDSLNGKTETGGRLNAAKAVGE